MLILVGRHADQRPASARAGGRRLHAVVRPLAVSPVV